jgi:hypothetical protein
MIPFVGRYYNSRENKLLLITQNPIIDGKEEKNKHNYLLQNNVQYYLENYYDYGIDDIKKINRIIGYTIEKWTDLRKCIKKYAFINCEGRNLPKSQILFSEIVKSSKEINYFKNNEPPRGKPRGIYRFYIDSNNSSCFSS